MHFINKLALRYKIKPIEDGLLFFFLNAVVNWYEQRIVVKNMEKKVSKSVNAVLSQEKTLAKSFPIESS